MTINVLCECLKKGKKSTGIKTEGVLMGWGKKGLRRELQKNYRKRKEGARDVHASFS